MLWVAPQPASSTDPPQTIESDDPLVLPTGTWTAVNTANASGGSYLYSSGNPTDTLAISFAGTTLDVIYVQDPTFGSFTVEIDSTAVRTVTATYTETVFGVISSFTDLDNGPHTAHIMGIQGTVAIDAFVANDFTHPWQTYNDDHADLMYHANSWTQQSLTAASGGTAATTSARGAMLTFFFSGTGVELVYAADENGGPFAVYVDFETRHAGNSMALSSQTGQHLTITNLTDGTHRVDLLKGQNTLRLEAIRVQGQLLQPPYERPQSEMTTGFQTESVQPPTGACDYSPTTTTELIAAINSANAVSSHDTICLLNGQTYIIYETYTDDWSGKNALPVLTSSITIDGNGATIRRDVYTQGSNSDFRYFYIDLDAEVTIDGLTLQYGDPESEMADNSGGAIYNVGELHLMNVTLNNNVSEGHGGAIFNGGDLTITGSDIHHNDADFYGGAISNLGGNTIQITYSTIDHNQAATGGAIYADFAGTTTIQHSTIENNWSSATADGFGGAFRVYDTPFNITHTSIGDNDAYNGGALYAELLSGYFTITQSCIYGNADISVANDGQSFANINAPNNWWGTSDGPSGVGPGSGDSITSNVTYTDFLTTAYFGCPKIPPACTTESSGYQTESSGVPGGNLSYCIPQITPTPTSTASPTVTLTPSITPTSTPNVLFPDGIDDYNAPSTERCVLVVGDTDQGTTQQITLYQAPWQAELNQGIGSLGSFEPVIDESNELINRILVPLAYWQNRPANVVFVRLLHPVTNEKVWGWTNAQVGVQVTWYEYVGGQWVQVTPDPSTDYQRCEDLVTVVYDNNVATPTPGPTATGPTPTPTPPSAFCVIYVQADPLNVYDSVVHARTEAVRGDVLPPTTQKVDTYINHAQLKVSVRYLQDPTLNPNNMTDQQKGEQSVVRIIAFNPNPIQFNFYDPADSGWQTIPNETNRWIDSGGGKVNLVTNHVGNTNGVNEEGGDCSNLGFVDRNQLSLSARDYRIEELRDFSIEVASVGQSWTDAELTNIFDGATRFSEALRQIGARGNSSQETFRITMVEQDLGYLLFLRLQTDPPPLPPEMEYFYDTENDKTGVDPGYCRASNRFTYPTTSVTYPRTVFCRGTILDSTQWLTGGLVLEPAVVHELGHVFDYNSNSVLSTNIRSDLTGDLGGEPNVLRACDFEVDSNGQYVPPPPATPNRNLSLNRIPVVMGPIGDRGWTRGEWGWGTPNNSTGFSEFQQNAKDETSHVEAVADMILNWVFRRTGTPDPNPLPFNVDPCGNNSPRELGNWDGFLNIDELNSFEPQLSGNIRYWWLDRQMNTILTQEGWR